MKTKQYLAIDIGGTSVKLGIVDETGAVLAKAEESVNFDGYETPILTTVCKAAKAFVEAQSLSPAALVGVGVSATGQIDSRAGTVVGTCGNLPHYIGSPIKAELESLFGLPVTVANDANCMCLGEVWVGGAKGYTDVIGVTLGTGVGGGVSAQQKLLIDPIAAKVRASVMPAFAEGLEIRAAQLHNDAGMVGAVYYFKQTMEKE